MLLLLTAPLSAHPGRTAADGCHYCRTNCDKWGEEYGKRHCHRTQPETRRETRRETPDRSPTDNLSPNRLRSSDAQPDIRRHVVEIDAHERAGGTEVEVIDVRDGDTLVLGRSGRFEDVDLAGIDAPEIDQPSGAAATRTLRRLARSGSQVRIFDAERDERGRLRARVVSADRLDLALTLAEAGLAWALPHDDDAAAAQERARAASRGLWSRADPVPPWRWRQRARRRNS